MKRTLFFFILLGSSVLFATPYKAFNTDALFFQRSTFTGKIKINIDYPTFNEFINQLETHVLFHPFTFDSNADFLKASKEVQEVTSTLQSLLLQHPDLKNDPKFLALIFRLNNIAYNLSIEKNIAEARFDEAAEALLAIDNTKSIIYLYVGALKLNSGQTDIALQNFQKALELGDYSAYWGISLAYIKLGHFEDSLKNMKKYQQHFPSDKKATLVISALEKREYTFVQNLFTNYNN